jgi:hypothetical protein
MRFNIVLAAACLSISAASAMAATESISASAQGFCIKGAACSPVNAMNTTFAGASQGSTYRDWFTFSVPTSFDAVSASVDIYSSPSNSYGTSPDAVFSLYASTGFSYEGLVGNGISLGTVTARLADPNPNPAGGHYVSIALNADGLAYINSNRGNTITFGGSGPDKSDAQFFGFPYSGSPALLTVTPVPEPETYAMWLAGLVLIGSTLSRRNRKQPSLP